MSQVTIGYINLSSQDAFTRQVRESLETEAARHPNLTLLVRESEYNSERTMNFVREFAELPVNLAIIFQIDELLAPKLASILMRKRIPIIAQDIHIPMQVYFGINNKLAGRLAGEALGHWINTHWNGQFDRLLVLTDPRIVKSIRERLDSAVEGLAGLVSFHRDQVFYLDSGSTRTLSAENVRPVLESWKHWRRIAVIALNDDSGIGVLDLARAVQRESDLVVVGQGGTVLAHEEFQNPGSRFIASTVFYPERYGPSLIELALRILRGEKVQREIYVDPTLITREIYLSKVL